MLQLLSSPNSKQSKIYLSHPQFLKLKVGYDLIVVHLSLRTASPAFVLFLLSLRSLLLLLLCSSFLPWVLSHFVTLCVLFCCEFGFFVQGCKEVHVGGGVFGRRSMYAREDLWRMLLLCECKAESGDLESGEQT